MRQNYQTPKPSPRLAEVRLTPIFYLYPEYKLSLTKDNQIAVSVLSTVVQNLKFQDIATIIAIEPVSIDSDVIVALLKHRIPVSIFASDGQLIGRIDPFYEINQNVLIQQINLSLERKLYLQRQCTWAIVRRYRFFILRKVREDKTNKDKKTIEVEFNYIVDSVEKKNSPRALNGLLGNATIKYSNYLHKHCIDYDFDRKMINAMTEFIYAIAAQIIESAILVFGLNPLDGFWHKSRRKQKGLVLDILSALKPYLDACVVRVINVGSVALKDFDEWDGKNLPPKVTEKLVKIFEWKIKQRFKYPHLETLNCSYEELIYIQVYQLKMFIREEIDSFYSLELR
jgi:CRISP-associated protein Cas1